MDYLCTDKLVKMAASRYVAFEIEVRVKRLILPNGACE